MNSIILKEHHIPILIHEDLKEEFNAGMISILKGEVAKASCPFMEDVFSALANVSDQNVITGIPKFDPTGMSKSEIARLSQVQAGKFPATGLDHSYANLVFRPITTLGSDYIDELIDSIVLRTLKKRGDAKYQRFLHYMAEVVDHLIETGQI